MAIDVPHRLRDRVEALPDGLAFQRDPLNGPLAWAEHLARLVRRSSDITAHTRVIVTSAGVHHGAGRTPHLGQTVRLRGRPGEAANLFINGAGQPLLYTPVNAPGDAPWSTRDILWLGRTISVILGLPWRVEWDRDAWDTWNHDPRLRGRTALSAAERISLRNHPQYHSYALAEPPGVVGFDRSSYTIGSGFARQHVHFSPEHVRTDLWTIVWPSVHGVTTVFEQRPGVPLPSGAVRVSYEDRVLDLVRMHDVRPLDAVHLRFLAEEVRTRARTRRRDAGSEEDVPEPLRHLRPPS
jgi:hypothetical protein